MAEIAFDGVTKIYPDGTPAVSAIDLVAPDGQVLVLVGPSGCGKSTALKMVAGLEEVSEGTVRIGDRVVNDLAPGERDVAMVFQSYALYPHMSVFDNMAFSLRMRKVPVDERRRRVEEAARVLGLSELLDKRPRHLSGGQRQRVAMGRAIVREPKAFLMDEPLSNLDAKLRGQTRNEIARIQRELGVTMVYVTHDQTEALTLGDRIAVMSRGVVRQVGAPEELYDRPQDLFVASFIGSPPMNLVRAEVTGSAGAEVLEFAGVSLALPRAVTDAHPALARHIGGAVVLGIRAEDLTEAGADGADRDDGGARIPAEVSLRESVGSEVYVHFQLAAPPVRTEETREIAADLGEEVVGDLDRAESTTWIARLPARARAREGERIELRVETAGLHLFDPDTGTRI
jgi:multiple sugar transport system ATP-binding protein